MNSRALLHMLPATLTERVLQDVADHGASTSVEVAHRLGARPRSVSTVLTRWHQQGQLSRAPTSRGAWLYQLSDHSAGWTVERVDREITHTTAEIARLRARVRTLHHLRRSLAAL